MPKLDTADLFLEFTNDMRCKILQKLSDRNISPAKLASELSVPSQEIHRQLGRLADSHLIEKTPAGEYIITTVGKIAISQFDFFSFMTLSRKFFSNHTTGDLSTNLIMRMGVLKNVEFIRGTGTVIEKYKEIVNEKTTVLRVTLPQIVVDANANVLKHAKKGMKVYYIHGKNTITPAENDQIEKKYGIKKLISEKTVERKLIEHVSCTVAITDKHAMLFFPNILNESDINCAFVGSDESFREWCIAYFETKWNEGENMDGI